MGVVFKLKDVDVFGGYMEGNKPHIYGLSRVLAVLIVGRGDYSVTDNIAHASSKTIALYYISERLRDYTSIVNRIEDEHLKRYASSIDPVSVERELEDIRDADYREFQTIKSMIVGQALAEANRILMRRKIAAAFRAVKCIKDLGVDVSKLKPEDVVAEIKARKDKIIGCGVAEEELSEIDEQIIKKILKGKKKQGGV